MKVYSDVLTHDDLYAALPKGVGIKSITPRGTRLRLRGWDVYLEGVSSDHRRKTNSGTHGAGSYFAASYDDHGHWMAALFNIDPEAIISTWASGSHFERGTEGRYSKDEAGSRGKE